MQLSGDMGLVRSVGLRFMECSFRFIVMKGFADNFEMINNDDVT